MELRSGLDTQAATVLSSVVGRHQAKVAKELLGVRDSAEAASVLTELSWACASSKARRARLQLWWRVGRTTSRLLRVVEMHAPRDAETTSGPRSSYSWWAWTELEVLWLVRQSGHPRDVLRDMSKDVFKRTLSVALW